MDCECINTLGVKRFPLFAIAPVATGAIANKGNLLTPRVLMHSQSKDGQSYNESQPQSRRIPIKNIDNWELPVIYIFDRNSS